MVQKKLQVLTEAGLAIDDFSEVESTALHDLKVVDILYIMLLYLLVISVI